uniref:Uncharacterized protein n=1 Tax=Oryza sativa subsp. japonica TaxID=39947 RepID=Q75H98_ORYSJ|nr:hypothetical protein [Oryza sativa Japonica Group]
MATTTTTISLLCAVAVAVAVASMAATTGRSAYCPVARGSFCSDLLYF